MRPLTLDDLLPLQEYAEKRREFFGSLSRYLDRYRRVRIGPELTLLFENRQTLWFRLQEVLRIARLAEPTHVQEELNLYNRLLPGPGQLQAALLIETPNEAQAAERLTFWQTFRGEDLYLAIGPKKFPAQLLTCRPEDRCIGAAHWVQFHLGVAGRRLLANFGRPAHCGVQHGSYQHESPPLSEDVRQSLLDDLKLSDGD
ncbi:MAG: DUF3501 family protein [Planctomycetes bacterium]|nr:DUF3501 family protein [Planctomycetota bacterium]